MWDVGLMRALLPLLVPDVVGPGDYLITEGDIGKEMYLVQRGELDVIFKGQIIDHVYTGG
jgi:hypothetical protein